MATYKVDPAILEREYVFDPTNPPISLAKLAAKHELSISGVAEKARTGQWSVKRQAYRETLGRKSAGSVDDGWVLRVDSLHEKMLIGLEAALDHTLSDLRAGAGSRTSARDLVEIVKALRAMLDSRPATSQESDDQHDALSGLDPAILAALARQLEQPVGDGQEDAVDSAEEGTRQN